MGKVGEVYSFLLLPIEKAGNKKNKKEKGGL